MSGEYFLLIRSPAGVKQAVVVDYDWLKYIKVVNEPGMLSFQLRGDHPAHAYLVDKALVEVWRRDPAAGVGWYIDFYSIYRGSIAEYKTRELVISLCPGILHMLSWRIVAFHSAQNLKSAFSAQKAEDVMQYLVFYNFSGGATLGNGRLRVGTFADRTIASGGAFGRGNTISFSCAQDNVLVALQKVARIGGGDFNLTYAGGSTWNFVYYPGQLGTDRSASVLFSLGRGNMANPKLRQDATEEKTVAIVGGKGEELARVFEIRTSTGYSGTNNIEVFRNNTNYTTTAMLQNDGDEWLKVKGPISELRFDILQQGPHRYGRDYFLGDLVSASYRDVSRTFKITKITVATEDSGGEKIDVEVE